MLLLSGRNTMRGAKQFVPDTGIDLRPTPRRDRLVQLSRKWAAEQEARKRREAAEREAIEATKAKWAAARVDSLAQRVGDRPAKVIARVAKEHGVTQEDILGRSRVPAITAARQAAMAEVYITCRMRGKRPYSLPELGRVFNRDHTTCLHALRKLGVKSVRGPGYMHWAGSEDAALSDSTQ